jgi:hypothetical protein
MQWIEQGGSRGGDQWLFEKIKVFFKNQKHEPNIVEITHLCIMHGAHTNNIVNDTTFACNRNRKILIYFTSEIGTYGVIQFFDT